MITSVYVLSHSIIQCLDSKHIFGSFKKKKKLKHLTLTQNTHSCKKLLQDIILTVKMYHKNDIKIIILKIGMIMITNVLNLITIFIMFS